VRSEYLNSGDILMQPNLQFRRYFGPANLCCELKDIFQFAENKVVVIHPELFTFASIYRDFRLQSAQSFNQISDLRQR